MVDSSHHSSAGASFLDVRGKVVAITGAAQGIGRACADGFARHGADLVLCDRLGDRLSGLQAEVRALGVSCEIREMDVRDSAEVAAWAVDIEREFRRVDVLVNNAGGGFFAPFMEISTKGQTALVAENFTQVADVTRSIVPLMGRGGSIINVTSIEGHRAGPGFSIYSAMKAAVENLTKTLALELADRGIRVNAIAPDMIETEGDAALVGESSALMDDMDATPVGFYGAAHHTVGPVLFLASDLSAFVSGNTIHVDGGTFAASGWKRRTSDGRWMI